MEPESSIPHETPLPPGLTLNHIKTVHAPHPTSWRYVLMLSSHLRLGLPSALFPSGLPTKTLYSPLFSPTCTACPALLILLDLITRKIFVDERAYSFSLCSLLHSPITSSLLVSNIVVSFLESTHFWSLSIFLCFRSTQQATILSNRRRKQWLIDWLVK